MTRLLERLNDALAGRYSVESEIGRGGMATVFLAEDLKHRRKVAIKVLHPGLASAVGAERFLNEVEIVAAFEHPHILTLIDSGEADGLLFYVMPYVRGESLRQRIEREGALRVEEAVRIVVEVADGLDFAHGHGVIHRDVKPGNILLSGKHAFLTDFGIARAITVASDDRLTATAQLIGTPLYASPEQAMGSETLDRRSDIYSLGCVLYEMLSGDVPLASSTPQAMQLRRLSETPAPLHPGRASVSPLLDQVVGKALAILPADRFATAEQFAQALLVATMDATPVAQLDLASTPALVDTARQAPRKLRAPRWLLIALLAVGLTSLGAWGLTEWRASMIEGQEIATPQSSITPPVQPTEVQLTDHGRAWQVSPAVSLDGRYVAYSVSDRPRTLSMQMARNFIQFLMVAELGKNGIEGEPRLLTQMQDCRRILWSPDGRHLLVSGIVRESEGTFLIPVSGGRVDRISERVHRNLAWAPDGRRLAVSSRREIGFLEPVHGGSGELKDTFELPTEYQRADQLAWSPRGDRLAVVIDSSGVPMVWTVAPDGSDARRQAPVSTIQDLAWASSGDAIYFSRAPPPRELVRLAPIDEMRANPQPEPLIEHCRWFSVSGDGRRLACQRVVTVDQTWLKSLDPASGDVLLTPDSVPYRARPYLSPNRKQIAYVEGGPEGRDLLVASIDDGTSRRLTHRGDVGGGFSILAWSPDGDYLAYAAKGPDDTVVLWFVPSAGGPSVRADGVEVHAGLAWAPAQNPIVQGRDGYYRVLEPLEQSWSKALADRSVVSGLRTRLLMTPDSLDIMMSEILAVSPDGATAAVTRYRRDVESSGVWLFSVDGDSSELLRRDTPAQGNTMPVAWTSEGAGVFVRDGAVLQRIDRATGEVMPVETPAGICDPEVLEGIGRFLCYTVDIYADVWIIEDFDPHLEQ